MRLFVILTVVSTVVAIPLPARPKKNSPANQSTGRPGKPYGVWHGDTWGNMPVSQPNIPTIPDAESGETEPTSGDVKINPPTSNPFQDFDPAEFTGNVLNGAWDTNAKVVDTIGKITGLGVLGAGAAGLWNVITGSGGVVPILPDVPNVPNVGAYSGS